MTPSDVIWQARELLPRASLSLVAQDGGAGWVRIAGVDGDCGYKEARRLHTPNVARPAMWTM
eukprot:3616570-Prymnesium_polylepis.1